MARGPVRAIYVTDDGARYWTWLDADYQLDVGRGFAPLAGAPLTPFPRGWRMRYAVGIDGSGRTQHTRIGTTAAQIWTLVQPTWFVETTDQGRDFARTIRLVGERLR